MTLLLFITSLTLKKQKKINTFYSAVNNWDDNQLPTFNKWKQMNQNPPSLTQRYGLLSLLANGLSFDQKMNGEYQNTMIR